MHDLPSTEVSRYQSRDIGPRIIRNGREEACVASGMARAPSFVHTSSYFVPLLAAKPVTRWLKRAIDIVGASLLLFLSAPLMLFIALIVALDGGPVTYRDQRIGRAGRTFGMIKFRTMMLGSDQTLSEYLSYHPAAQREWAETQKLEFDPRITAAGRFLRHSSLDELPQLLNVLRGEMSLVGPRPIPLRGGLSRYGNTADLYVSVRPGITGLWQVSGRNDLDYASRVALDARYICEWTLALDVRILLRTPLAVLSGRGAR